MTLGFDGAGAEGPGQGPGHGPLLRGRSAAAPQGSRFGPPPEAAQRFGASWSDDEEEATERDQEWEELNTTPHAPDDPDRAYA